MPALPALEELRRQRRVVYALILSILLLLCAAVLLIQDRELYHSPRVVSSPDGRVFIHEGAAIGESGSRIYVHSGPEPENAWLPGAVLLPTDGGVLVIGDGRISMRGETRWSRPLGVDAIPLAAMDAGDGSIRFFGSDPSDRDTMMTWVSPWAELKSAEPVDAAPAVSGLEVIREGLPSGRPVWPFLLEGRIHVAWWADDDGTVVWMRRGDTGWQEAGMESVRAPFAVFPHDGDVWILQTTSRAFRVGKLTLVVRRFGEAEESEIVIDDFRILGKRSTGVAVDPVDGGMRVYVTRMSVVQSIRLEYADGAWRAGGPLEIVWERPPWRMIAEIIILPAMLLCSLMLTASGTRVYHTRQRLLRQVLHLPEYKPTYAGPWERTIASMIDLMVLVPVLVLGAEFLEVDPILTAGIPRGWLVLATLAALMILQVLYSLPLEWIAGQTLGKRLVGIRVVDADGKRPSLWRAVVRNLMRLIDSPCVIGLPGFMSVSMSERRQRMGDRLAGTIVVPVPPKPPKDLPNP